MANPVQAGANAELNRTLGQMVWATVAVYTSGLLGMLLLQLLLRQPLPDSSHAGAVPWWAWTGGLVSILATVAGLQLAQRLGSGIFTGVSITASLVTSIAIDHFGWLGFKQHTATPLRMVGAAVMAAGLWLVMRF